MFNEELLNEKIFCAVHCLQVVQKIVSNLNLVKICFQGSISSHLYAFVSAILLLGHMP